MPNLFPDPQSSTHRYADIILPLALPQVLTYGVPVEYQDVIQPGLRAEVSLGKNKQYAGIVARIHDERPEAYEVKPIRALLDEIPVVNAIQLQFWKWIAEYYVAAPGEVMQAALPAHLKLSSETKLQWRNGNTITEWSEKGIIAAHELRHRGSLIISELRKLVGASFLIPVIHELLQAEAVIINDGLEETFKRKTEKILSLSPEYHEEQALQDLFDALNRAPKQLETLMSFLALSAKTKGEIPQEILLKDPRANAASVRALNERGVFQIEEKEVDRLVFEEANAPKEITFTKAQERAYKQIHEGLEEKSVVLLQGVTGSGKTLLYIQAIREVLAQGKQAIFLLPEIGLTTQLVRRLQAYFGEELGVYHSRFSNNERIEIWEKVQQGKYRVVVGPRSAIWLPYQHLGIIICDEEHDGSYKQRDPAPRFHARDAAIYLAGLHKAHVILGSATPSIESL
ncbi:MAG: DEAD/DEAH box helicase, partial [Chitinophagaceae bacterium]